MTQPTTTDPTEKAYAESLGISRDDLRRLRNQLLSPADWDGGAGLPVTIKETGRHVIELFLERKKNAEKKEGGGIESTSAGNEATRQPASGDAQENPFAYTPIHQIELPALTPEPQHPANPQGLPTLRVYADLKVFALTPNKQLLLAVTDDNKQVRVQVKANELFKAGMLLKHCRKDGPCIFTYQGPMPRRKGKW